MLLRAISIAAITVVTGCASITTGQDQVVSVQTPNCPNVSCELTNKEGTYYVSDTPGTVSVNRKCSKMTIQCSKEGEPDYIMTVSSSVKGMTFGNILFGGFIGVGVDAATGAACEYPSVIPVPMECGGGESIAEATPERKIPERVLKSAEKLDCTKPSFVGGGPNGKNVYSANCEGSEALLTCGDKKCTMSKYSAGDESVGED